MKKLLIAIIIFSSVPATAGPLSSLKMPLSLQHKAHVDINTGALATGNIDNENFSVSTGVTSTYERYKNELKGNFSSVDLKNGKSENIYKVNNKLKYEMSSDNYVFGEFDYANDKSWGINHRVSGLTGYGHKLLSNDDFSLTGEAGVGMRKTYYSRMTDEGSYLGKLGALMDWELTDAIKFQNNTYVAFTEENRQTVSENSIKAYVIDNAYVKGSFDVENNNHNPVGIRKTNTITRVGVGLDF